MHNICTYLHGHMTHVYAECKVLIHMVNMGQNHCQQTVDFLSGFTKHTIAEMKYTQAVAPFNDSAQLHNLIIGPQLEVVNPRKCPYSSNATPHCSNFKLFVSMPKKRHK